MRKHFTKGVGMYYFNVYSGNSAILIGRTSKQDATNRFISYKKVGKKCEWLGCWNGKKYEESNVPKQLMLG